MQSNFHTTMIRSASLLAATVLSCLVLPHRHCSLHNDYNLTSDNDYDNDNDNYNYNNDYYNNDGLPYNCQCSLSCNRVCPVSIKSVWMSKCCSLPAQQQQHQQKVQQLIKMTTYETPILISFRKIEKQQNKILKRKEKKRKGYHRYKNQLLAPFPSPTSGH